MTAAAIKRALREARGDKYGRLVALSPLLSVSAEHADYPSRGWRYDLYERATPDSTPRPIGESLGVPTAIRTIQYVASWERHVASPTPTGETTA